MKRFRVFSVMLVFLLALGMVFISCGDDSGSNSGGGDPGNGSGGGGGGGKVYPIDISEGNDWPPSSIFEKYNLGNMSKPSGLVIDYYTEREWEDRFSVYISYYCESASLSMFRTLFTSNGYVETNSYIEHDIYYFEKTTGGIRVDLTVPSPSEAQISGFFFYIDK